MYRYDLLRVQTAIAKSSSEHTISCILRNRHATKLKCKQQIIDIGGDLDEQTAHMCSYSAHV